MGSCWCTEKVTEDVVPEQALSDSESSMSEQPPPFITFSPKVTMIRQYIIQMVQMVGNMSQTFDDHPVPLIKLHMIADEEEGWQRVVEALIITVPLSEPLGPSAITIIFDDCPLPAIYTVLQILENFGLGRMRALSARNSAENKCSERNMLIILGCIAEKFAGPISTKLLTENVMEYMITYLLDQGVPLLVLHSLVTIEKFAKTKENKIILQALFSKQVQHPLVALERYSGSEDPMWRQIGFCARWLLDNTFILPERSLSYTTLDMSAKNAILDCNNATDFLKISPDGLEARCDVHTFESARCTFQVNAGCWYYEAEVLTTGVMQIGWATQQTKFSTQEGYGIGDDHFSLAYDGCRRLMWHKAAPKYCEGVAAWEPGDILGCMLDLNQQIALFTLNGVHLPVCRDIFKHISIGFYAAASFMCFQGARFNFGLDKFRYAPTDRAYMVFNDHGTLTEGERQVVPRWLLLERRQMLDNPIVNPDEDAVCAICYDRKPDTIFSPCRHTGFCRDCAFRVTDCPMCRERVWHYTMIPF